MEEEWNQTSTDLQTAREQISDLNLQVTILTSGKTKTPVVSASPSRLPPPAAKPVRCLSEMGVLRQKLTEREEERAQLERKVTELSATVSSTLASHTFLEQALDAESTK